MTHTCKMTSAEQTFEKINAHVKGHITPTVDKLLRLCEEFHKSGNPIFAIEAAGEAHKIAFIKRATNSSVEGYDIVSSLKHVSETCEQAFKSGGGDSFASAATVTAIALLSLRDNGDSFFSALGKLEREAMANGVSIPQP
jgi:hypothetical protein